MVLSLEEGGGVVKNRGAPLAGKEIEGGGKKKKKEEFVQAYFHSMGDISILTRYRRNRACQKT